MPTMTEDTLILIDLPAVGRRKGIAHFASRSICTEGGLVLLCEAKRRIGLADTLVGCIREWRDRVRRVHSLPGMLSFRMCAIACQYEDADDCDDLRAEPAEAAPGACRGVLPLPALRATSRLPVLPPRRTDSPSAPEDLHRLGCER